VGYNFVADITGLGLGRTRLNLELSDWCQSKAHVQIPISH